jgi:hypothetical protein
MNNSRIEGSVQELLGENLSLNGGATITGDLLVPGAPTIRTDGYPTLNGIIAGSGSSLPNTYTITLNGGVSGDHIQTRTDAVTLPSVVAPPTPTGMRTVSLTSSGQSAGDFATLRNLTVNCSGMYVAVPPGTYGNFTANGNCGFVLGVAGSTQPAVYNLQARADSH